MVQRFFIVFLIFSTVGCTEHTYDPHTDQNPKTEPSSLTIDHAPPLNLITRSVVGREKNFLIEQIQFGSFSARYWHPDGEGFHPAILLLPAIWGDGYMDRLAQDLTERGFACLQFPSHRYLDQLRGLSRMKMDSLAETLRQQVAEAGQVLHWLSTQPGVDPERIGILGTSIGAIIASLLTEADGRIQAAAYLLGGGNLPEIMVAPQGYVKKRVRERIMSENGLTEDEFKKSAVQSLQRVDPLTYAGRLDAGRILMVNGRFDQVIPYDNARELWDALGQPDWVILPAGHYTASFFFRYIRHRVTKHFIEQFTGN
jgi:pimeloyl-ACP methyl ester carboxylesterase